MKVLKIILIVLMFLCMIAGLVMLLIPRVFKSKISEKDRKSMKIQIIGYVLFLCAFALAIFQSLIKI